MKPMVPVKLIALWSWRTTIARGSAWKLERHCETTNAPDWKRTYEKDEPAVSFALSVRMPRYKPNLIAA